MPVMIRREWGIQRRVVQGLQMRRRRYIGMADFRKRGKKEAFWSRRDRKGKRKGRDSSVIHSGQVGAFKIGRKRRRTLFERMKPSLKN